MCSNSLLIDQRRVDQQVLQAISDRLVTPERRERAVERALELLRNREEESLHRQATLIRDLSSIEGQLQNLLDAICRGGANVDALLERLKSEEARKKALMAELDRVNGFAHTSLDIGALRREVRQRLADARSLLGQELPQARQILRKVLTEPARCQAIVANGQPVYRITLKGSYAHLLPHPLVATRVASPTGPDQFSYIEFKELGHWQLKRVFQYTLGFETPRTRPIHYGER